MMMPDRRLLARNGRPRGRRKQVLGLTIKHTTDTDELQLVQDIIAKYGFGVMQEQGDDLVAACDCQVAANLIADMDRELIGRIGGHLEVLLG